MYRAYALAVILVTVLAMSAPRPALACSCVRLSPAEQFVMAEAVFVGRVADIDDSRDFIRALDDPRHRLIDLYVSEHWKGVDSNLMTVATGLGGGDCGLDFQPGKEYLVYAHDGSWYGADLSTGICDGTLPLVEAASRLDALGPGSDDFSHTYARGSGPIREGVLWWVPTLLKDSAEFVIREADRTVEHSRGVLLTGSASEALLVVMLYLAAPIGVLYALVRFLWRRKR